MKVILLRDVARIGKRGEVKDVPAGHALNFLIPRKHALPASEDNLRRAKEVEKHTATKSAHHEADFKGALLTLATTVVEIPASANAQGHLFKGLHAADIAKRFSELNIPIAVSEIELKQAIKEVGEHTIVLRAHDQEGTCVVRVIPQ